MSEKDCTAKSRKLIEIDQAKVTEHLSEIVLGTVEEMDLLPENCAISD